MVRDGMNETIPDVHWKMASRMQAVGGTWGSRPGEREAYRISHQEGFAGHRCRANVPPRDMRSRRRNPVTHSDLSG